MFNYNAITIYYFKRYILMFHFPLEIETLLRKNIITFKRVSIYSLKQYISSNPPANGLQVINITQWNNFSNTYSSLIQNKH